MCNEGKLAYLINKLHNSNNWNCVLLVKKSAVTQWHRNRFNYMLKADIR